METSENYSTGTIRSMVLSSANNLIHGEREQQYGKPEENFKRIADLWKAYFGGKGVSVDVTPGDVAYMMVLLKMARAIQGGTMDTSIDMAGYVALAAELQLKEVT